MDLQVWPILDHRILLEVGGGLALVSPVFKKVPIYDILSTNITFFFASHRKSVHKPKIRPIVNPSIAPKNGLLISKGFRNLRTDILPVSQFLD